MPSYFAKISIIGAGASVWATLVEVTAWPQWLPTVHDVQALDSSSLQQGSRFTVRQPKLRPATWTVTKVEAPRRFEWESRSPGVRMVADHVIWQRSATQCEVTLTFTFSGLLGAPLGVLFRSITQRYLEQEAGALKTQVEGSSAAIDHPAGGEHRRL